MGFSMQESWKRHHDHGGFACQPCLSIYLPKQWQNNMSHFKTVTTQKLHHSPQWHLYGRFLQAILWLQLPSTLTMPIDSKVIHWIWPPQQATQHSPIPFFTNGMPSLLSLLACQATFHQAKIQTTKILQLTIPITTLLTRPINPDTNNKHCCQLTQKKVTKKAFMPFYKNGTTSTKNLWAQTVMFFWATWQTTTILPSLTISVLPMMMLVITYTSNKHWILQLTIPTTTPPTTKFWYCISPNSLHKVICCHWACHLEKSVSSVIFDKNGNFYMINDKFQSERENFQGMFPGSSGITQTPFHNLITVGCMIFTGKTINKLKTDIDLNTSLLPWLCKHKVFVYLINLDVDKLWRTFDKANDTKSSAKQVDGSHWWLGTEQGLTRGWREGKQ